MTRDQAEQELIRDIWSARMTAIYVCDTYAKQPVAVRRILVSMAWQLGQDGLAQFTRFMRCVNHRLYALAALEMRDSRWYRQTPARAEALAKEMENVDSGE